MSSTPDGSEPGPKKSILHTDITRACKQTYMRIRDGARRHSLLATLYVAVAIPGILSSLYAGSSNLSPPARLDERGENLHVLNFDSSFSAGTLHLREPSPEPGRRFTRFSQPLLGWAPHGPARGEVVVPHDVKIWLELELAGVLNPSLLADLAPDCLYRLSIAPGCPPPDDALIDRIAQLSGLRELDLRHAEFARLDGLNLNTLGHLECLWLRLPEEEESREYLLDWARRFRFESEEFEETKTLVCHRVIASSG